MQKLCARSGYVIIALFGLAFWPTAQFIPVPAPTLSVDQIAAFYQQHTNGIRFGMLLMSISGALVAPFVAGHLDSAQADRGGKSDPLLGPVLQNQNYHLIHHLYQMTPFYNNRKVWHLIESELRKKELAIQHHFSIRPKRYSGLQSAA